MNRNGRMGPSALRVLLSLTLALFVGLQAQTALGITSSDVTGMDYYYGTGEDSNTVDILSVTGAMGDTVFVEMRQGDRVIASHLAFTLTDDTAQKDATGYVGVVSVTIADFDPSDDYTVAVYEDRAQTKELYSGAITPVYAQIEGSEPRLIALRTQGTEKRDLKVPSSVSFDNATYTLASDKAVSKEPLTYEYELSEGDAIDGSVTYVDDEGNALKTEEIAGIAQGTSKTVAIPPVITVGEGADATYWRTVHFGSSVTAAYPGTSDFTIVCKPLSLSAAAGEGDFYFATIQLVDEEGTVLATDSLNVTGPYLYTPPTRIHLTGKDGLVNTYVLSETNDALNSSGVLALNPATDGVTTGSKTYTITYGQLLGDASATWTVVLVNGAADPKSDEREIRRELITVNPGETATYKPLAEITIDDTVFVPVTSTKDEYTYTYGAGDSPMLIVYYVPDGYVAPEPYEITVRYVNIANNEVLQSHTLTSRPELRDELEITSPERFTQDGVEYVRLDGQEKSLWHSFYSSTREYTIYYRDINDDLSAGLIIQRINVEYDDVEGETVVVDNGTTTITTDDGVTIIDGGTRIIYIDGGSTTRHRNNGTTSTTIDGGTTTSTTDGGSTNTSTTIDGGTSSTTRDLGSIDESGYLSASIPSQDGLSVIAGGDNALVVDGSGRDTNTMRIEDDATPLAGPSSQKAASATGLDKGLAIGIGTGLAALIGFLLFIFFKRRKDKEDEEDVTDAAE